MIKVDIISGFLGAGKTTFIKKLIDEVYAGEKIVLIENEFGEIGIDSHFMKDAGVEVTEMNSGCICCTLVGDFAEALKKAAYRFAPDRIIIEPSGVGKLSEVAEAVQSVHEEAGIEISGMITVVDGKKMKMYLKNFNEFYSNQIEHAVTVVVSRTQLMDESMLSDCMDTIRQLNHEAAVITTPWDKLGKDVILDAIARGRKLEEELVHEHHHDEHCDGHEHEHNHDHHHHDEHCDCHEHYHEHHHHDHDEHCSCGCHEHDHEHHHDAHCDCGCHDHHHHHADEVFDSWGAQTVHKFSYTELEDTLKMLAMSDEFGTVLRAKGIVEGEDGGWMEFDMVPEEIEIRDCAPDYTGRVCVIGTDLNTEYLAATLGK